MVSQASFDMVVLLDPSLSPVVRINTAEVGSLTGPLGILALARAVSWALGLPGLVTDVTIGGGPVTNHGWLWWSPKGGRGALGAALNQDLVSDHAIGWSLLFSWVSPSTSFLVNTGVAGLKRYYFVSESMAVWSSAMGSLVDTLTANTSAAEVFDRWQTYFGPGMGLAYDLDIMAVLVEVVAILTVLSWMGARASLMRPISATYADFIASLQSLGISATEVGVTFSFFAGLLFLDVFLAFNEEDVTEVLSVGLLVFVIGTFATMIIGLGVQYYYLISGLGNGDLTIRVVIFDFLNNFLCILRIFFCWVRYVFYDAQVEALDFVFHYTDALGQENLNELWASIAQAQQGGWKLQDIGALLSFVGKQLVLIWAEAAIMVVQAILGAFKLGIALFLVWLIVDLFVLKPLSIVESRGLVRLR